MDIMKLGAQLIMSKLGGGSQGASLDNLSSMLGGLISDNEGKPNLQNLVSGMKEKGMGNLADSWLGDGDNEPISNEQVRELVGGDKVAQMAKEVGGDEDSLLSGLADALPQVVDKSSRGGSLLDSVGGLSGALNMAKSFFK